MTVDTEAPQIRKERSQQVEDGGRQTSGRFVRREDVPEPPDDRTPKPGGWLRGLRRDARADRAAYQRDRQSWVDRAMGRDMQEMHDRRTTEAAIDLGWQYITVIPPGQAKKATIGNWI